MGTKTMAVFSAFLLARGGEKRIPTHGDENSMSASSFGRGSACEKRLPKHGDENNCLACLMRFFRLLVKKESPNMGTIQFPVLYQFLVDDSYLHVVML